MSFHFLNYFCFLYVQVGSGKTSLLNSLLGEMRCVHGSILLNGSVAYVPQVCKLIKNFLCFFFFLVSILKSLTFTSLFCKVPWILSGTIRENILFGKPFDSKRSSKFSSSTHFCS